MLSFFCSKCEFFLIYSFYVSIANIFSLNFCLIKISVGYNCNYDIKLKRISFIVGFRFRRTLSYDLIATDTLSENRTNIVEEKRWLRGHIVAQQSSTYIYIHLFSIFLISYKQSWLCQVNFNKITFIFLLHDVLDNINSTSPLGVTRRYSFV